MEVQQNKFEENSDPQESVEKMEGVEKMDTKGILICNSISSFRMKIYIDHFWQLEARSYSITFYRQDLVVHVMSCTKPL